MPQLRWDICFCFVLTSESSIFIVILILFYFFFFLRMEQLPFGLPLRKAMLKWCKNWSKGRPKLMPHGRLVGYFVLFCFNS